MGVPRSGCRPPPAFVGCCSQASYDLAADFLADNVKLDSEDNQLFLVVGWRKPDKYPQVLFYVANIIDYFRVVFLYLAVTTDGTRRHRALRASGRARQ